MTVCYSIRRNSANPFVMSSSRLPPIDTFPGSLKAWAKYTAFERRDITRQMQRERCYLCNHPLWPDKIAGRLPPQDPAATTDDHVLPKSAGGGWPWNLLLAHRECNGKLAGIASATLA